MGKHGPCYHCGVTSTPLWRNGPPEKPVLCNACGSRWRTKGNLDNYTPLHARAEGDEIEDYRVSKVKMLSIKNKEAKVLKRKYNYNFNEFGPDYNQGFRRVFDEDTSNRSSSGSALSNTESCAQYGSADASDLTGLSQPVVWDSMVPSRKRTCVTRPKPSPVEELTKDLYTIWHEQQSSCLTVSSEENLLLESDKQMVSVEIGHGSVLIRHPSSIVREEESEASSLSIDNKRRVLSSQPVAFPGLIEQEQNRRDKNQLTEKMQIMAHHNSPLCHIDLNDPKGKSVINESESLKSNALATDSSLTVTRSREGLHHKFSGAKAIIKSPKSVVMNSSSYEEVKVDKGYSFFSPKSLFCSDYDDGNSEQDLLLDIHSNGSFPQAELLSSSSFGAQASTNSCTSVYPYFVNL
ncbi:hypothetical protein CASFOL_010748 [Castilleja foliolosa]|uniref:GATA-type domain-containing protein n=1 Tax=Castilleja foliolosa TaxID=1961234 RepID=A0ABD3DTI4_9LAMI